ncbi:hypothetical protein AB6735_11645 [Mucilaginibacter sp. RCC_168]|uniref:hypothetical protein n=1 Tax=Mucilaginibacter sp. RCC_168 TaxID=3239221 RepID=UPI0035242BB7
MFVDHKPFVDFPVFYPFFLSIISWITGLKPYDSGPIVNGCLFFFIVFISGYITERFTDNKPAKWVVLLSVMLSAPLQYAYAFLWSETVFICLLLMFFLAFRSYSRNHLMSALLLSALLAGLGSITRYAGITMIVTGVVLILIDRYLNLRTKILHLIYFGIGSCLLLTGNLIRNYFLTNTHFGSREPAIATFKDNILLFGSTIYDWLLLPVHMHYSMALPVGCMLLAGIAILIVFRLFVEKVKLDYPEICATFFVVYSCFMIITASISRFETLNSRLFSPLFIPLIMIFVFLGVFFVNRFNSKGIKALAFLVIIVPAFVFNFYQYQTFKVNKEIVNADGIPGFSDLHWKNSQLGTFLRMHPNYFEKNVPIYSDNNEASFFFSGKACQILPHKLSANEKMKFSNNKTFYVVWFDELASRELISSAEIEKGRIVKNMETLEDGTIFLYSKD